MRPILLAWLLVAANAAALDLEPKSGYRELEGARIPMVEFKDSPRPAQWSPPVGWRMSYDQGVLSLKAPDRFFAGMEMRVVKRNAGDLSLLSKAETIPQFCAAYLPSTAKKIVYRETSEGAFTIGPTPAREYILEFEDSDQAMKASVCILEYSQQQRLILVISAQPRDFPTTRDEAITSMFSWRTE